MAGEQPVATPTQTPAAPAAAPATTTQASPAAAGTPTPNQLAWLKRNPARAAEFEARFGAGSAAQYLKAEEQKAQVAAEAQKEPLVPEQERDVVDYAADAARGAAVGFLDMVSEGAQTVSSGLNFVAAKVGGTDNWFEPISYVEALGIKRPETTVGNVAAGVSQFATGFAGALRFAGLKLANLKGVAGAAKAGAAGAAVDFALFDPYLAGVTDWVEDGASQATKDAWYTALSTNKSDPEFVARAKKAAEGLVLGGVVDSLAAGLKLIAVSRAKRAGTEAARRSELEAAIERESGGIQLPPDATMELPPGAVVESPGVAEVPMDGKKYIPGTPGKYPKEAPGGRPETLGPGMTREKAATENPVELADEAKVNDLIDKHLRYENGIPMFHTADAFEKMRADKLWDTEWGPRQLMIGLEQRLREQPVVPIKDIEKAAKDQAAALGMRPDEYVNRIGQTVGDGGLAAFVQARQYVADALSRDAADALLRYFDSGDGLLLDEAAAAISRAEAGLEAAQFARAETGRALRSLQSQRTAPDALVKRLAGLKPEERQVFIALADQAKRAGGDPMQTLRALTAMGKSAKGMDYAIQLFKNSILTGPATHAVNAASNAAKLATRTFEDAVSGIARGDGVRRSVARSGAGLVYSLQGYRQALAAAKVAFSRGSGVLDAAKGTDEMSRSLVNLKDIETAIGSGNPWQAHIAATKALLGDGALRLLGTMDETFKQIGYRSSVAARAYDEGYYAMNLRGDQLDAFVNRKMAESVDPVTGRALDPKALEYAREVTFTQELRKDTVISGIGRAAQNALGSDSPMAKMMQLVIPFVKTPTNIIEDFWQRSPLNLNLYREMTSGNPKVKADAIARFTTGAGLTGLAITLHQNGLITGNGPADPNLRKAWLADHQPNAVKVGDKWVSFGRLDPGAAHLSVAADAMALMDLASESDRADLEKALATMFARQFTNKTYLKNLGELLEGIMDPESSGGIERTAQSVVGAVVPSLVGAFSDDEYLREVRSLTDAIKARIPGYSETLPVRRNFLGEPMLASELGKAVPLAVRTDKDDEVLEKVVAAYEQAGRQFTGIPKTVDGVDWTAYTRVDERTKRPITAYDAVQEELGNLPLRQTLKTLVTSPGYDNLTPDAQANLISRTMQDFREVARKKVLSTKGFEALTQDIIREKATRKGAPSSVVDQLFQ